ncbi:hypothetical protein [Gimesia panareensis]|uniref:Uncharacterized protein n=1 Tax=Gimesia panareensis TaxID=2527978 RepID=A0A517Q245_9PLAN|nr:hypothetical protein [Gimesia panareensis]QDT25676.1 hypothetical protein Enr10x_09730 [Gimesia panareensis]QDU48621.1 hypothetical protein Pan110_09360 [Gimesia panareensis]
MRKFIPLFTLILFLGTLPLLPGCGSSAPEKASGPVASMQNLMQGVSEQKMEVVWEFLPASYQSDVNGLAHQFADKMDPEIYNEMFGILQRVSKLLQDKKEYVLKNEMLENPQTSPEEVAKYYDPSVDILTTLANSDLSSLEKLKTFDGGKFLASSGTKIAKDIATISDLMPQEEGKPGFYEKLKQAKVTLISEKDDMAKIKIEVPGEGIQEEDMVKVEDKWIPKTLADNWKSKIDSARQNLDKLKPEDITAKKDQALAGFKAINATLAQLENAKTEKEFNDQLTQQVRPLAAVAPMMLMMMAQSAMQQGGDSFAGGPQAMNASPGEAKIIDPNSMIDIVINKKLSPGEQDPIIDEILQSANDTESLQVIPNVDGEITTFKVFPVEDVEAFSKKIKFGKPTKVDAQSRSITVELK